MFLSGELKTVNYCQKTQLNPFSQLAMYTPTSHTDKHTTQLYHYERYN